MTVTYTRDVATVRLCHFPRLLRCWRGSVYKLLYRELLLYCILYYIISMIYRFALNENQQTTFEKLVIYFDNFGSFIPVTFILGFYITLIVARWWNQYISIPWPDRMVTYIAVHMQGHGEEARIIRRTLVRYIILALVLICQSSAPAVKKRFPTIEHLISSGLMMPQERVLYDSLVCPHHKYWIPIHWAAVLFGRARRESFIQSDIALNFMLRELNQYKAKLAALYNYDWISIPLVYTQVTTISVYVFFFSSLIGSQFINPERAKILTQDRNHPSRLIDFYVPIYTLCQLFFYLGLLKVAESMINPFGEDDDDFEVNWIIDRNLQVGLLSVDGMYDQLPPLEKDMFWENSTLPYTKSTQRYRTNSTWMGSVADMNVNTDSSNHLLASPLKWEASFKKVLDERHLNFFSRRPSKESPEPSDSLGRRKSGPAKLSSNPEGGPGIGRGSSTEDVEREAPWQPSQHLVEIPSCPAQVDNHNRTTTTTTAIPLRSISMRSNAVHPLQGESQQKTSSLSATMYSSSASLTITENHNPSGCDDSSVPLLRHNDDSPEVLHDAACVRDKEGVCQQHVHYADSPNLEDDEEEEEILSSSHGSRTLLQIGLPLRHQSLILRPRRPRMLPVSADHSVTEYLYQHEQHSVDEAAARLIVAVNTPWQRSPTSLSSCPVRQASLISKSHRNSSLQGAAAPTTPVIPFQRSCSLPKEREDYHLAAQLVSELDDVLEEPNSETSFAAKEQPLQMRQTQA